MNPFIGRAARTGSFRIACLLVACIVLALLLMATNGTPAHGTPRGTPAPLVDDAAMVPQDILEKAAEIAARLDELGSEPAWNRTSDFMVGSVSVAIVLPECIGGVDDCSEAWTSQEVTHIAQQMQIALDWWEQKASENGAAVDFRVVAQHPVRVPTQYEPIQHAGGGVALCGEEGLWIDEVMMHLGYDAYPPEDYLLEVFQYNNDLRSLYHTDWAFTAFVADSSNNPTGMFAEDPCGWGLTLAGWAHVPGPHFGMNNINDGYGNIFVNGVAAHEIGHVFGAPDEAASNHCRSTQPLTCDTPWGYLGGENQNCYPVGNPQTPTPCLLNIPESMMRWPQDHVTPGTISNVLHPYNYRHFGWHDGNSNSIPDTIDTWPTISLAPATPDPSPSLAVYYTGIAEDIPLPSAVPDPILPWRPGYPDETINKIVAVEYRLNGGPWIYAEPSDGAFDSAYEQYHFWALACQNGAYTIQVRGTNTVGHASDIASDTVTIDSTNSCKYARMPACMGNIVATPPPGAAYPAPGEDQGATQQSSGGNGYPYP